MEVSIHQSHAEAMDVCEKLDLLNGGDDITEEPVPAELDDLLCLL